MSVFIEIKKCSECPFFGHSGGFTVGGAQPLCENKNVSKDVPRSEWGRPLLNPKSPAKWPKEIPDWCPLTKPASLSEVNKACRDGVSPWIMDEDADRKAQACAKRVWNLLQEKGLV